MGAGTVGGTVLRTASSPLRGREQAQINVAHIVNFRGWPGLSDWHAPPIPRATRRLSAGVSMTLCAAADIGADGDTFGLGAVLVCYGTSRLHSILLVPDDITPTARAKVKRWAWRHRVPTATRSPALVSRHSL